MNSLDTSVKYQAHPGPHPQLTYGGIAKLALGTIVGMVTFAILLLVVFVAWSIE